MKKPQEKAKELVDRFIPFTRTFDRSEGWRDCVGDAKQCALIAVDEIIILHKGKFMCEREEQNEEYWQQVKQEIELL